MMRIRHESQHSTASKKTLMKSNGNSERSLTYPRSSPFAQSMLRASSCLRSPSLTDQKTYNCPLQPRHSKPHQLRLHDGDWTLHQHEAALLGAHSRRKTSLLALYLHQMPRHSRPSISHHLRSHLPHTQRHQYQHWARLPTHTMEHHTRPLRSPHRKSRDPV